MKVIKRDGKIVDYDRSRIVIAIEKANAEVRQSERATKEQINEIIEHIEELGKKRILVEDIQDIIEKELMALGKYELAKKYMIYRYTRALARKQNTTDESILGVIKNENKNPSDENSSKSIMLAATQRDYIAGEISEDLTKRILLPEKISKAHEDGILYFHNADYFIQPIFNCSLINIGDMLDNGTAINGKMIESPKGFTVACNLMTQIIATVASNQYGEVSVNISHLGKYLRKSKEKFEKNIQEIVSNKASEGLEQDLINDRLKEELVVGVQTILYQVNTLMTTNGCAPRVTLFLNLKEDDEYIEENAMIIEEILNQSYQGIKDDNGVYVNPEYPKLVYVLDEQNHLDGGKYDYLTELAIKCTLKNGNPNYISAKQMKNNYDGNVFSPMGDGNLLSSWKDDNGSYKFEGRFNQGIVSINLPQIALTVNGDENEFWNLLDERLDLCKDALMCRYYSLKGTFSDSAPILWQNGAIARLKKEGKIDQYLEGGYSSLSLGYVGLYEVTKLITGESHTTAIGHDFAVKLVNTLKETILKWKKETGIGFLLYEVTERDLCERFAKIDKEKFGTIEGITDRGSYTNLYYNNPKEEISDFDRLKFEGEFQNLSNGGGMSFVNILNLGNDVHKLEEMVKFIYDNVQYVEFLL